MGNPASGTLATFVLNDLLDHFFKEKRPRIQGHKYVQICDKRDNKDYSRLSNHIYDCLKARSKQQHLQQLKTEDHIIDLDRRYNNAALDNAMKSGHEFDFQNFEIIQ